MTAIASTLLELMSEQAGAKTAWVHLVPAGTSMGKDGRGPYTLRDADAVISLSRELAGKRQIVVDYDHQSHNAVKNGQPAPAAGWIVAMQARENGIWGLVEWTDRAARHIAAREYRYISPAFHHEMDGTITAIADAALVNKPNLDQLTSLNRAEPTMDDDLKTKLKAAAALLGLPETAGQEQILGKLKEISTLAGELASLTGDPALATHSTNPDPAKYVPIGDFERVLKEGNTLRQGVALQAAQDHVERHVRDGALPPYLKPWAISLCTQNKPSFDTFMDRVGPYYKRLTTPSLMSGEPPPRNGASAGLAETELAVCSQLGLTEEEFKKVRSGTRNTTE